METQSGHTSSNCAASYSIVYKVGEMSLRVTDLPNIIIIEWKTFRKLQAMTSCQVCSENLLSLSLCYWSKQWQDNQGWGSAASIGGQRPPTLQASCLWRLNNRSISYNFLVVFLVSIIDLQTNQCCSLERLKELNHVYFFSKWNSYRPQKKSISYFLRYPKQQQKMCSELITLLTTTEHKIFFRNVQIQNT